MKHADVFTPESQGPSPDTEREALRESLTRSILTVTFTKKDGTLRTMLCTTRPDRLPPPRPLQEGVAPRPEKDPDLLTVWDLEHEGWRSFHFSAVQHLALVLASGPMRSTIRTT